ncbi:MAG: hypothetical protein LC750_02515 [Actinobacteria bacterium]|nr:hypothetical protein [Actinomycetota bacterium]
MSDDDHIIDTGKGTFLLSELGHVEVANVKKVIEDQTWDQFDDAFEKMVSQANAYHELFDKPFLRWKVPDMPPPDLDLTPR